MKLTIIPVDGMVIRDGNGLGDLNLNSCKIPSNVLALQWFGTSGWIEFKNNPNNQDIIQLPGWAASAIKVLDEALKPPPPPTAEEKINLNKVIAESRLQNSDWVMLDDVSLANKDEWISYRTALRKIAINPTADAKFPTKPKTIWAA
jgi:hypothetical protein